MSRHPNWWFEHDAIRRLNSANRKLVRQRIDAMRVDQQLAIALAPPRVTSTVEVTLGSRGAFAAALTGTAILFATTPLWGLCIAAPLLIYIWWHLTRATIRAAATLDDHTIPPARVLSEGPK